MNEGPYFAEGTEAMLQLEAMLDKVGLCNLLYAVASAVRRKGGTGKAETIETLARRVRS